VRNANRYGIGYGADVNNALAESAKLLQRSAEKFSQDFRTGRGAQDEAIDLGESSS